MKKWKGNKKKGTALVAALMMSGVLLYGCGSAGQGLETDAVSTETADRENKETADGRESTGTGLAGETAADAAVDIRALREENPDIFAWIYVPGTDIDGPVLQSEEADDYYEGHDAYGKVSREGALYTELANLKTMCDFNTVIHGKCSDDGKSGLFAELYRFADSDFFKEHENVYIYLDGNLLTYEVFAAYERDNTSLIRTYDFTYMSGCQDFLNDLYGTRQMGMNLREGWEDLTPYHFLITLTTGRGEDPDRQFVVVAALISDAAGTIDRMVVE